MFNILFFIVLFFVIYGVLFLIQRFLRCMYVVVRVSDIMDAKIKKVSREEVISEITDLLVNIGQIDGDWKENANKETAAYRERNKKFLKD